LVSGATAVVTRLGGFAHNRHREPGGVVIPPLEIRRFLDAYRRVAGDMSVHGNLVPDVHVAVNLLRQRRDPASRNSMARFQIIVK
jgi:hypothetical protein